MKLPAATSGRGHTLQNLEEQAEVSYKQSLALESKKKAAWHNFGNLFRRKGDARQALGAYQRAVVVDPEYSAAWSGIVLCWLDLKDWAKAASSLETLAKLDAGKARALAEQISELRIPDFTLEQAVKSLLNK